MDLFGYSGEQQRKKNAPLASRMRPRTLDEFVGQGHVVGEGKLLRRAIQADVLGSLILYGPPGSGKTALAHVVANTTRAKFITINAVLAGVKDIREAIAAARDNLGMHGRRTILFVDEVHRFNKAQQDALLPSVEDGTITFIGATTENPFFEVIRPLVSRSRVFQLNPLTDDEVSEILRRALADGERGLGSVPTRVEEEALAHLVRVADGDARNALNALELAVTTTPSGRDGVVHVTLEVAQDSIQKRVVRYARAGDDHYDTISAFIKSVRGSDPDAALFWLAKMVYAGEDPRFIMRRLFILAAEDVGLADPGAITVVAACADALEWVGLPEAQYHLGLATLYLATVPKSNSVGAYWKALDAVKGGADVTVPTHLMDSSRDSEAFGHGEGYKYPHAFPGHHVGQQYLPDALEGTRFYEPCDEGYEGSVIKERLARWRARMKMKTKRAGET